MTNAMKSLSVTCAAITMLATAMPTPARAAGEPAPVEASTTAPTTSAASPREVAHAQFKTGLARYEMGDYAGAIESWTLAHELMAPDADAAQSRHVLGLDLAQAHVRAYRIDGDRSHFDPAERLIDDYIAWVDRPGHTMDAAEQEDRPRALEMLAFLEDQRAARAGAPVVTVTPPPRVVAPAPADAPAPAPRGLSRRTANILIGTGAASLALGVGSVAAAVAFGFRGPRLEMEHERIQADIAMTGETSSPELEENIRKGRRNNAATIASITGATVFTVAGVALLTTGLVKRRRLLRATPAVAAGYGGLTITGRF